MLDLYIRTELLREDTAVFASALFAVTIPSPTLQGPYDFGSWIIAIV